MPFIRILTLSALFVAGVELGKLTATGATDITTLLIISIAAVTGATIIAARE
jgi:hypothetical protein